MLIPSAHARVVTFIASLSRRVNANSQHYKLDPATVDKLIKKGEC